MNYIGPKVRLSRKLGIPLTRKSALVMERKSDTPGQHGKSPDYQRRMSNFKRQLLEKQRLRAQYNIHEKQMRHYYQKAARQAGDTSENLIQLLETRLDAIVYRSGLAPTIYTARQLVSHGHFEVNGKKTDYPSFQLKAGDIVQVCQGSHKLMIFRDSVQHAQPQEYIRLSKPELSAQLRYVPNRREVPVICELSLVIEYYSK